MIKNCLHRRIFHIDKIQNFQKNGIHSIPKSNARKFPFKSVAVGVTIGGLLTYDGIVNNFIYSGAVKRFTRSLSVGFMICFDYFIVLRKKDKPDYNELFKSVHLKSAQRILDACLKNGGLYIKIGQGVAAINHILPDEYIQTLSKLEDECLPYKVEDVQSVFKKDFGKLPEEIYEEFNYTPIAAASLAQVFRGKLKTGEEVAIKVQYDDLEKRFPSDLGTILFLQELVEIIFKDYNFGWIIRNLRENLEQELDFTNEGKNSEKCANDLKHFKYAYVPKVYWDYTRKRILTMEWIDGIKITDNAKLQSLNIKLKNIDVKLFNIFSEQIFNTGFVHADPHPGNIFVRKLKGSKDIQLVLLDHGLYEKITEDVRVPLSEFWEATVLKDENKMKKTAQQLNVNNHRQFAEVLFQVPFQLNAKIRTKLTDEDIRYMQEMAKHNFSKVMDTLREMPRNMLFIVRNLNTIRAISRVHGDPINRPKLMARYAQKCLYRNQNTVIGFLKWVRRRLLFEYHFLSKSVKLSTITLYINILYYLGRSPQKYEEIFAEMEKE